MDHFVRTDGKGAILTWLVTRIQKDNSGLPDRFFEPVRASPKPVHNIITQSVAPRKPARVGGVVTQQWAVIDKTLDAARNDLLARLADLRWQRETGGIEVGGLPIRTDRETQGTISRARQSFIEGDMTSVRWKMGPQTWITLGQNEITAIAGAVTTHVASCFDAEGDVSDIIIAATDISTLAAIDMSSEFNTAYGAAMTAAMAS